MKLNEIRNNPGAHTRKTKVGRGTGSGLGKTCGRGVKGAKARSGNTVNGFEGGQMPLHMRLPKRGFNNIFANDFTEITLGRIEKAIEAGKLDASKKITFEVLREAKLIGKAKDGVRLLANGGIKTKIDIEVAGASAGAIEAVKAAGGSIATTFEKKVYKNKNGELGKRQQRRAAAAEKKAARA